MNKKTQSPFISFSQFANEHDLDLSHMTVIDVNLWKCEYACMIIGDDIEK